MELINKSDKKNKDIIEKLTKVFNENFGKNDIVLTDKTSPKDIEDWNSLEQVSLAVAIQDEFCIKLSLDEVNNMKNVGDMKNTILWKIEESE